MRIKHSQEIRGDVGKGLKIRDQTFVKKIGKGERACKKIKREKGKRLQKIRERKESDCKNERESVKHLQKIERRGEGVCKRMGKVENA